MYRYARDDRRHLLWMRNQISRKNQYARVACAPLCWQGILIKFACSVLNAFLVQFQRIFYLRYTFSIFDIIVDATQHCASSADGVDSDCESACELILQRNMDIPLPDNYRLLLKKTRAELSSLLI